MVTGEGMGAAPRHAARSPAVSGASDARRIQPFAGSCDAPLPAGPAPCWRKQPGFASRTAAQRGTAHRVDEALRRTVIGQLSAGSRKPTQVRAIRLPASSTWRPSAGYWKLAMKARARHPGSLHPDPAYQPSVARPMNPLLASASIGLSRRCASAPSSKFTLPWSSTPRP